jgi:hypothetical protein
MAFGVAPTFAFVQESGRGNLVLNLDAATLAANAGAFDPTGAAADSGLMNSNNGAIDAVPANTTSLPTNFGPGQDNWSQEDADALEVLLNDAGALASALSFSVTLVPNVNPLPPGSTVTNNNVVVGVHNRGAAAAGPITGSKLKSQHSLTK